MNQRTKTTGLSDKIVRPSEFLSITNRRTRRLHLSLACWDGLRKMEIYIRKGAEVILYDPQNPELLEKKPYDILRGLGFWFFGFSVLTTIMFLLALPAAILYDGHGRKIEYWIAYFVLCFFATWLSFKIYVFSKSLISHSEKMDIHAHRLYKSELIIMLCYGGVPCAILMVFILYKLRYVLADFIRQQSQMPTPKGRQFLFQNFDPIEIYGLYTAIACCFGLLFTGIAVYFDEERLMRIYLYVSLTAFLLLGVISASAFRAKKEWGRLCMVIFHFTLCVLPVLLLFKDHHTGLVNLLGGGLASVIIIWNILPILHWCYFVIRTLNHPVVRDEFLRGGRILDEETIPDFSQNNNGEPRT